ncbi:MAG: hypothetical protein HC869_03745 [Rhodospirillales bacterium]|nr:hypothetical protein [Rhodospirillales bacterium]
MSDLASDLYLPILVLHSGWRWIVLVALAAAVAAALADRRARSLGRVGVIVVDLQLTIGLLLYLWLSPVGMSALRVGAGNFETLFFGLLHFLAMLLVVVLAHVAGIAVRRGATRRGGFVFLSALAVALIATPWWRPLIRI